MMQKRLGFTLGELLVVLGIIFILVLLISPLMRFGGRGAREAARRNQCMNNLKQIGIALELYEQAYGSLPPAYTVDADGNRLHSWRTLILPFIDEKNLFESIDLSKPWDDPANEEARKTVVTMYHCPSDPNVDKESLTIYLAVVGPDCVFSGSTGRKLEEIKDDKSQTLMVFEANHDRAVHWMSPNDATEEALLELSPEKGTYHDGVFNVVRVDGSIAGYNYNLSPEARRAMLTTSGGEDLDALDK